MIHFGSGKAFMRFWATVAQELERGDVSTLTTFTASWALPVFSLLSSTVDTVFFGIMTSILYCELRAHKDGLSAFEAPKNLEPSAEAQKEIGPCPLCQALNWSEAEEAANTAMWIASFITIIVLSFGVFIMWTKGVRFRGWAGILAVSGIMFGKSIFGRSKTERNCLSCGKKFEFDGLKVK
jgi:hypothetical protein